MDDRPSENKTLERDFIPQRFTDLFLNPSRLMGNVGRWPRWWIAGILILLANGIATTWVGPIMLEEYKNNAHSSQLLLDDDEMKNRLENAVGANGKNKFVAVLTNGMNSWSSTLLFSLMLVFFCKMAGGKGSLNQGFGIVHWAALLPQVVGTMSKAALSLNTGEFARITLSPATFLPGEMVGGFIFVFLDTFADVTVLWGLMIVVVGFEVVFQLDRTPALLSVLMPWALASGVMVGIRLMFGF